MRHFILSHYKTSVYFAKKRPVLALNSFVLFVILLFGYYFYAGQILPQADALGHLAVTKAESLWRHMWNHYTQGEGRFTVVVIWGVLQRIVYYAYPDVLDVPIWILVVLTQFSLVGSALNFSVVLRRIFEISYATTFLIFVCFLAFYSSNPKFFVHSLQPGSGMYAGYTYLFSVLCILGTGQQNKRRRFCLYFVYVTLLLGADTMWGASIFMMLFVELVWRSNEQFDYRALFFQALPVVLIPLITGLIVFASPGYQARVAVLPTAAYAPDVFGDFGGLFGGMIQYCQHVVNNTYGELFSSHFFTLFPIDWHIVHGGILILFCGVVIGLMRQHFATALQDRFGSSHMRLLKVVGICLVGFVGSHSTLFRWFVSRYHGQYANDGPSAILLFFLFVVFLSLSVFLKKEKIMSWKHSGMLSALLFFVFIISNVLLCMHQVSWAVTQSKTCVLAYNKILNRIQSSDTDGTYPKSFVITGTPISPIHFPYVSDSAKRMLTWMGIQDVHIMASGFPNYAPSAHTEEIVLDVPIVEPYWQLFQAKKLPQLVRTQVFQEEYIRDYWVPLDVAGWRFLVNLNPNLQGNSFYLSRFHYEILFSAGWDYGRSSPGYTFHVTLLAKSEGKNVSNLGNPVSVTWVVDGKEVEFLPPGSEPILRIKVRGGHSSYIYGSSNVVLGDL